MSDYDYVSVPQQEPETNGLGIAGFVVSLVGLVTCGLLAPVGLILSAIALRRAPRGLAIAGTIMGVIGLVLIPVAGFMLAVLLPALSSARSVANDVKNLSQIEAAVTAYAQQQGSLPPNLAALGLPPDTLTDIEGNAYLYEVDQSAQTWLLISPGSDGSLGTADDRELYP